MSALAPTTLLEAINTLLATIGEAPVNSLDDSGVVDAVLARTTLEEQSRALQTKGWHWNSENNVPLALSFPDKFIYVPENTLSVDASLQPPRAPNVTLRGRRLYNLEKRTFAFDEPIEVDLVLLLPFDELPEAARRYITLEAARLFQDRVLGSDRLTQTTRADSREAMAELKRAEIRAGDYNILNGTTMMHRILRR